MRADPNSRARRLAVLGVALACAAPACAPPDLAERCTPPRDDAASLLAVGDTGDPGRWPGAWYDTQQAVARVMAHEHARHPVRALVLLGDNFYPEGLRREDAVERIAADLVAPYCGFLDLAGPRSAEVTGACGVARARRRPVPVVAVLGNHDVMSHDGAYLQRRLVPDFVPGWRIAPFVAVEEIAGGLSVIHFDAKPIHERQNRHLRSELRAAIAGSRGPWRVLVAHNPLLASGEGGDRRYRTRVLNAIRGAGVPVHALLAGHDHNLQAAVAPAPELPLQIVAGSGSSARDLRLDVLGRSFGLRAPGFARVEVDAQGLVISLVSTAERPLEVWRAPRVEACHRVEADGRVHRFEPTRR